MLSTFESSLFSADFRAVILNRKSSSSSAESWKNQSIEIMCRHYANAFADDSNAPSLNGHVENLDE